MTITDQDDPPAPTDYGFEYPPVPRMPRVQWRLRLKSSPALRRLLPTRLVVARAERKGRRLFDTDEQIRARALRTMEAVVGGTEREGELEQIARAYVVERQVWDALFWQPWRTPSVDERSRQRLLDTCGQGRGAVLSGCHLGPYFSKVLAWEKLGLNPATVCGDWWFDPPSNDWWGRRLARWRRGAAALPCVRARGTFDALTEWLRQGGTTSIYFELPGRHETRFLGKTVEVVDGSARLAVAADALVLPVRSRRAGHRVALEVGEPIDPREHGDRVDEVHDALARSHERFILEDPAALQDPAEFGWQDRATATAWRRPARQTATPAAQ